MADANDGRAFFEPVTKIQGEPTDVVSDSVPVNLGEGGDWFWSVLIGFCEWRVF